MGMYTAMLRGINVSGQKLIKMEALKASLLKSGLKDVKTYIQSGNIIFSHPKADATTIEKKIEKTIAADFGFEVPAVVKTAEELEWVLKNNAYLHQRKEDINHLYVTFLAGDPEASFLDKIKTFDSPPDEFLISGKTVFLCCPKGYGNSKLSNNFFESKLKVKATTRNWKTVQKLWEMMKE